MCKMCKKLFITKLKMYQEYHANYLTKISHFIGVPLLFFSLLTLTSWVHIRVPHFFDMPLAWLLSIAALIYYFMMDITLAGVVAGVFLLFNLIISLAVKNQPSWASLQVFLYTFILGLIFQFLGHFIEKKKPVLKDELRQLIFIPMCLVAQAFFYFGQMTALKKEAEEFEQT